MYVGYDPRFDKMADVLVNYSIEIKPKQTVYVWSTTLAQPLMLAIYKQILKAGFDQQPELLEVGVAIQTLPDRSSQLRGRAHVAARAGPASDPGPGYLTNLRRPGG